MKKILIISYYWPPNAGVGARRWLNFQKHLSSEYSITVYTPENPNIFNEEIYSFRRIRLAPILVITGFIIEVYAILTKSE